MSGRAIALLVVLMAFALAPAALAAESFTVDAVSVRPSVLPGETALFELQITNTGARESRYTVSSREYSFILLSDPRPSVAPGATETYGVEITPRSFVGSGTYRVPLTVRSQETGETEDLSFVLGVRSTDQTIYTPSIALSVGVPDQVDPRQDLTLNIGLRNRNARAYTRDDPLTISIRSDLFEREYQTQLGGVGQDGEKTSEIRVDLEPYEAPGIHPLLVRVRVGNATVSEQNLQFEIIEYSNLETQTFDERRLFKYSTTYRVRNEGNVDNTARIVYPISTLMRPFLSSTENYEITEIDGERVLIIERTLAPLEEAQITVTENYRLLALLILLAIASAIGYYLLRSPVVLGKEASITGTPEEGVSEIRVRILVKNRGAKTMRNLRIVDRMGGMADIVKEEALGTVRPSKIVKKKGQGTLLRWDLDQLEPFEERIITYRARSPLKLVGDVTLPAVKVKYDLPSGRERTTHSNDVSVSRG